MYIKNEAYDNDKLYEVLSTTKNKELKIKINSIEKYKDIIENPDS